MKRNNITQIPATLVRLSIGMFNNAREDQSVTAGVKALHKLSGNAGRWVKNRVDDNFLVPMRQIANATRTWNYSATLTWEEGYRLLPMAAHDKHAARFGEFQDDYNTAVSEFCANWEEIKRLAKQMHNGTYNPADYPDAATLRSMFYMRMEYSPVPHRSHFIGVVAGAALAGMQQDLEARNEKRIREAVQETWLRLLAPIKKMSETLGSPDQVFRDSLVENVREQIAVIGSLNITNDSRLTAAAQVIEQQFAKLDADMLRTNKVQRKAVAQAAEAVVKQFGSFAGRKLAA